MVPQSGQFTADSFNLLNKARNYNVWFYSDAIRYNVQFGRFHIDTLIIRDPVYQPNEVSIQMEITQLSTDVADLARRATKWVWVFRTSLPFDLGKHI